MTGNRYLRAASPEEIKRQLRTFARMEKTHSGFVSFLRETAKPRKGSRLLELGCGCGMMADRLRREFSAAAEGWDSNPDYIAYAAGAYPRTAYAAADLLSAPARSEFDLILFRETLMEFPSPAAVLQRNLGRLKRGGWFAALEPDYGATVIHPEVPGWRDFVDRYARFCAAAGNEDFFAGRKLPEAFLAAGLRNIAVRPLVETHSFLDRPALREFLGAEIMSIKADAPLLAGRVLSAAGLAAVLKGLAAVARAPGAYVQTSMVAVCGQR